MSNSRQPGLTRSIDGLFGYTWVLPILLVLVLHGVTNATSTADVWMREISQAKCHDSVYELRDTIIDSKSFIRRAVIVSRSVRDIWPLLTSPDRIMEMIPKIRKFEVLESYPDSTVMLCRAKPKWYLKTFSCTLYVVSKTFEKMRWVRTAGDFKSLECCWEFFTMTNGCTLAVFSMHFELGGLIPAFLVNRATKDSLPKVILRFRDWITKNSVADSDKALGADSTWRHPGQSVIPSNIIGSQ